MTQEHPSFIVLGAPKCGTNSLYDYLAQHPEIYLPRKDLNFFGADLEYTSSRPTLDEYMSHFEGSDGRLTGDISVYYLMSERAPAEIYAHNPSVNLIAMLRNPVDLMYSMHGQALYNNDEHESDFERALALEKYRANGEYRSRSPYAVHATYYRRIAKLGSHLARFRDVFPPEQIHAMFLGDLEMESQSALTSVCEFLGISPLEQVRFPHSNQYAKLRLQKVDAALTYIPRRIVPRTPLTRLPRPVKNQLIGVRRLLRRINTTSRRRAPMDQELRARLTDEFVPEIEKLENLLGRDLSAWKC